ncbi:MAG: hypothetical protein R2764_10810 [Bacteroidales bacterium]
MHSFNSDTRKINYYDGYGWVEISGVKQTAFNCGSPLLDSRDGKYYNTVNWEVRAGWLKTPILAI